MAKQISIGAEGLAEISISDGAIRASYVITGEIKVPSGDTDYIPGFFVDIPTGYTAQITKVRAKINGGTSVTLKLTKNGDDVTGFTGISVTTTAGNTTPTPQSVSNEAYICPVVTNVSGTPKNMSLLIVIELTKT